MFMYIDYIGYTFKKTHTQPLTHKIFQNNNSLKNFEYT